jgi:transcriptional regulator with XRE-family HTH domain
MSSSSNEQGSTRRDADTEQRVAQRIADRRRALGLTASEVARRLGIESARYRHWERLFGPLPRRQYGDALCRILSVEPGWLDDPAVEIPPPLVERRVPTVDERCALGRRLRGRRKALGLKRADVAAKVGLSETQLRGWETCIPARPRSDVEAKIEAALQVPNGYLRDSKVEAPPIDELLAGAVTTARVVSLNDAACATAADEMMAIARWLTRSIEAQRVTRADSLTEVERRRALMFGERYGVPGSGSNNLQAIGDRHGLTRERVRQVIQVMVERARNVRFVSPFIDQVAERIARCAPIAVGAFDRDHRAILGEQLSVGTLLDFCREILGRGIGRIADLPAGTVASSLDDILLAPNTDVSSFVAIRAAAMRLIRSCGAAHDATVAGLAGESLGRGVTIAEVHAAVRAIKGAEWLAESEGWFWLGDGPANRVLTIVKKIIAVAERRVDVQDLHQGVCRSRRFIYDESRDATSPIEVPWQVLRELLVRTPWLKVWQKNDFALAVEVAPADVLSAAELLVFELIARENWIAAHHTLVSTLVDSGQLSLMNLQIVLSSSPIIRRLDFGIYAIIGRGFSPDALASALAKVGGNAAGRGDWRYRETSETDEDGCVTGHIVITDSLFQHRLVSLPARLARAIPPGEYSVGGFISGSASIGMTPSDPNRVGRLATLLVKAGLAIGESVELRVNVEARHIDVQRATRVLGP